MNDIYASPDERGQTAAREDFTHKQECWMPPPDLQRKPELADEWLKAYQKEMGSLKGSHRNE